MRFNRLMLAAVLAAMLAMPAVGFAKSAKKYQVTGTVVSVTADMIVVQKGDEKWEIDRDTDTKVTGDLKKGDKVTIEYTMSATNVEVKSEKADKAEKPKAK